MPGPSQPNSEPPSDPDPDRGDADQTNWLKLAGIGTEFAGAILGLGWFGWWLDSRLHTGPWLAVTGGALGFAAGLWIMVKAARQMFR